MGFVQSANGGANWYPPTTGYTPLRGSMGVPGMGMASLFPDMSDSLGPMGNMLMQTMGYFAAKSQGIDPFQMMHRNMTPVESMYGRAYQGGLGAAFGRSSTDLFTRALTAYHTGLNGGADLSANMQKQIKAQSEKMSGLGMSVMQLAPMFGINAGKIFSELPGIGLYQGIREMRGGTMLPGRMDQSIHQNLMKNEYFRTSGALSAGERGSLLGALGQRGLLNANPADLSAGENTGKYKSAVSKLEKSMRGWEDLTVQLKGIFGAGRGIDQLLSDMDRALGGSMGGMGTHRLQRVATNIQTTMLMNHMSAAQVTESMAAGAQGARAMGMVGAIGADAATAGTNIGEAMVTSRGGLSYFGQRGPEELGGIMTRRIMQGRVSKMGMVGGGVLGLMQTAAMARGTFREGMTAAELARSVGAGSELTRMAGALQSGSNSPEVLKYFSEGQSHRLALELQRTGITSTVGEGMNKFSTFDRNSQDASNRWISNKTLLGAQEVEAFQRVIGTKLRRPLIELGLDQGAVTSKIGAIQRLFASGRVNTLDVAGTIKQIGQAATLSETGATAVFNTVRNTSDSDPRLRNMGGFEEIFGRLHATPAMEQRKRMADALATMGNLARKHYGPESITARLMDDLTAAPDAKGRDRFIKRLLGDKSGGALGSALTKFGTAQEALENGIMTGASSDQIKKLQQAQIAATADVTAASRSTKEFSSEEKYRIGKNIDQKQALEEAGKIAETMNVEATTVNLESQQTGSSTHTSTTEETRKNDADMGNDEGVSYKKGSTTRR